MKDDGWSALGKKVRSAEGMRAFREKGIELTEIAIGFAYNSYKTFRRIVWAVLKTRPCAA